MNHQVWVAFVDFWCVCARFAAEVCCTRCSAYPATNRPIHDSKAPGHFQLGPFLLQSLERQQCFVDGRWVRCFLRMLCLGSRWSRRRSTVQISGWWFGCHQFYFPINIGLLIIPIDSYFSEGWHNHQPDIVWNATFFGPRGSVSSVWPESRRFVWNQDHRFGVNK